MEIKEKILEMEKSLANLPMIEPEKSDLERLCPHLNENQISMIMDSDYTLVAIPDPSNENGFTIISWSEEEESAIPDDPSDYNPEFDDGRPAQIEYFSKIESYDESFFSLVVLFAKEAMDFTKSFANNQTQKPA